MAQHGISPKASSISLSAFLNRTDVERMAVACVTLLQTKPFAKPQ